MPYIPKSDRAGIDCGIAFPQNCGELNYTLTRMLHRYIKEHELRYKTINEVIGVLECIKSEMYRMVAAPYENKKRMANGAISELDAINLEEVR